MSDDIKAGDMVARVGDGKENPVFAGAIPDIGKPVLCTAASRLFCGCGCGATQIGLRLLGFPVSNGGWHNAVFYRKLPPADLIEEPRRACEPVPA